ncbi:hypothetical protein [Kitasatospora sp. NBC_00458]|uniref:hypothetical protein n=1 Tax=Kitasatospora sp. NBC_00458 TaxID=2903568 RepID=UPI002E16BA93
MPAVDQAEGEDGEDEELAPEPEGLDDERAWTELVEDVPRRGTEHRRAHWWSRLMSVAAVRARAVVVLDLD